MPWLFGRRKSGKPAKLKEGRPATVTDRTLPVAEHASPTRQRSQRRRGRRSSRSIDSMRDVEKQEHIHPALRKEAYFPQASHEDITALPAQRRLQHSPHLRPVTLDQGTIPYNFQSHSHASLPAGARERGKLQRPQSLRRDPASESLVRRISSKRRREHDHIREEEIRAMSLPMPQKRPAGNSGGMLRRDSKKVKGGLNHRFERPESNISLPVEDSIHSSMSGNSELRAFRVSTLDMFSPRPTIRCSVGSQYYSADRTSPTAPSRNDSRRERRPLSNEEKQKNRTSRIDDLADTLDAGALREILERDKRRKDKKARADQERLRRRLERRAEKQNAAAEAKAPGTPRNPRRSATGVVGLGIEKEALMPMEDVRPSTPPQPQWVEILPITPKHENSQLPTPLESPMEEAVVSDARAIRYSRGSVGQPHTRGPSNVSMLPELISEKLAQEVPVQSIEHEDPFRSGSLHPVDTVETTATSHKPVSSRRRSSEGRRMSVFASFFRRGTRSSQDQGRTTPSEISFSNTSRESMSRQPLPAHLVGTTPATPPIQIRRPSSVPRRTMSKFREDLPEFPISPPDSRVQSPEVPATSAIAARRSQMRSDLRLESLHSPADGRSDSPVSPGAPTTNIMSQSLASVDSEASWLSGRPPKRASNLTQLRSSVASSAVPRNENFNASYEELGMADDEYFRRLTPQMDDRFFKSGQHSDLGRKASSTLMALDAALESEEEQEVVPATQESSSTGEEELVQSVPERQPTIIHRQPRVKSTEGLLSFYTDQTPAAEELTSRNSYVDADMPDSPSSETEPVMVQRAKSVDLGKHHVRHLSAGSARLLDIQKRSSTTSRRRTSELD